MGFNSAFKGLRYWDLALLLRWKQTAGSLRLKSWLHAI